MTKVLAFCDYLQEPMGGGAEIVSAEVYQRLASADGFSIDVLTGVPGPASRAPIAGPEVRVSPSRGVDLSKVLGAQLSIAPGLIPRAWRAIRGERPDVIHASSLHFFGSFLGAVCASVARIPLVTTCHLSGLEALPRRTRMLAGAYEKTAGRFILGRSQRVIAVSNSVRDHIRTLGIDESRIEVIENGVDSKRFAPGVRCKASVTITFVGRMIDNKGPGLMIDAFRQLDADANVRLRMVGTGPLEAELRALAETDARVQFLGHRDDVNEILASTDIFVRPSLTEGRSLAVLEAMAAGCAVIATDIVANAELVVNEETGLLTPPGEIDALRSVLQRLVDDRGLRERLGRAARRQAERACWETATEATGAVLREAAEHGTR